MVLKHAVKQVTQGLEGGLNPTVVVLKLGSPSQAGSGVDGLNPTVVVLKLNFLVVVLI